MGRKTKIKEGDRFGRLTVIKNNGSYTKPSGMKVGTFLCQCDCGNFTVVRSYHLTNGNTKSCGCLMRGGRKLPNNQTTINKIIKSYKNGAKARGYEWNLSNSYAKELITKECFYCGAKFSNEWDGYKYNGIDRVDNGKGYEEGNVVPCCKVCNVAKHDMTQKDFIFWARSVVEHTNNLFLDGERL